MERLLHSGLIFGLFVLGSGHTHQDANTGPLTSATKPHIFLILADDFGWADMGYHRKKETSHRKGGSMSVGVATPTLDSLIEEGIHLDRHYVASSCAPSRASLQSGRVESHVNSYLEGVTVHNPQDLVSGYQGIPLNMTTIAKKMKDAGYKTAMFGKWDAGMATPVHTPYGRGYDECLFYFQHANDYFTKSVGYESIGGFDNCLSKGYDLFIANDTYRGPVYSPELMTGECQYSEACINTPYCPCYKEEIFKQQSLNVIRKHDLSKPNKPLFLMHAFGLVHTPLQVPEFYLTELDRVVAEATGLTFESDEWPFVTANQRTISAMVYYMDQALKELVDAFKRRDMWKDTLLVFTTDNGGPIYQGGLGNNYPLRGGKLSTWEGGIRANAFVSGGFVPSEVRGTSHDGLISIADWYVTFGRLAGLSAVEATRDPIATKANLWIAKQNVHRSSSEKMPLLKAVDGINQWPALTRGRDLQPDRFLSFTSLDGKTDKSSVKAVLRAFKGKGIFKLVTGQQWFSTWSGPLFPNCSGYCPYVPNPEELEPNYVSNGLGGPLEIFGNTINTRYTDLEKNKTLGIHNCDAAGGCFFNVDADPAEANDLIADPAYADILAQLRLDLAAAKANYFQKNTGSLSHDACSRLLNLSILSVPSTCVANSNDCDPATTATTELSNLNKRSYYGPWVSIPEWNIDADAWYTVPTQEAPRCKGILGKKPCLKLLRDKKKSTFSSPECKLACLSKALVPYNADQGRKLVSVMEKAWPILTRSCGQAGTATNTCLKKTDCWKAGNGFRGTCLDIRGSISEITNLTRTMVPARGGDDQAEGEFVAGIISDALGSMARSRAPAEAGLWFKVAIAVAVTIAIFVTGVLVGWGCSLLKQQPNEAPRSQLLPSE